MADFNAALVGINKYDRYPLKGCVNDITIMRDILINKYKVRPYQIRTLVDLRATKQNIIERLEWLVEQSYVTKNLLFYYSGHGAQLPNQNYETDNECDGMDEILCPVDFNWESAYIADDQIGKILDKKNPECRMVMVFDCCHSGTGTRTLNYPPASLQQMHATSKAIPTPIDLLSRTNMTVCPAAASIPVESELFWNIDSADLQRNVTVPAKPKLSLIGNNVIAISGCKDEQTSADAFFGNRYQGALSYCLQKHMYMNPSMSLQEMFKQTVAYVKRFGFEQDPVLTIGDKTDSTKLILT